MGALTRSGFRTIISSLMGDENGVRFTTARLDTLLDFGAMEISRINRNYIKTSTGSTTASTDLTKPTDMLDVYLLVVDSNPIERIDSTNLLDENRPTGVPTYYFVEADKIGLYPLPDDAYSYSLKYSAMYNFTIDGDSLPVAFGNDADIYLTHYVCLHLALQIEAFDSAAVWRELLKEDEMRLRSEATSDSFKTFEAIRDLKPFVPRNEDITW